MIQPPDDVPFPHPGGRRVDLTDLAAELGALRARVDNLAADRDDLKSKLHDAQQRITDLSQLGTTVNRLSSTVQGAGVLPAMAARAQADEDDEPSPGVWSWAAATRVERAGRILEIGDWLHIVLRPRYPTRTRPLLACWAHHPAVVEELSWLYGVWLDTYASIQGSYRDAGDWHDRWLAGVLHRFTTDDEFGDCEQRHAEQLALARQDWNLPTWQLVQQERRGAVWDAYERLGHTGDPRFLDPDRAEEVSAELLPEVGLDWDEATSRYVPEFIFCRRAYETDQARVWDAYAAIGRQRDPRYLDPARVEEIAGQLSSQLGLPPATIAAHLTAYITQARAAQTAP